MEISLVSNATLTQAARQAHSYFGVASATEIACLILAPLLALVIGVSVNRLIDRRAKKTLGYAILDFSAPLLSSALAMLFVFGALQALSLLEIKTYLLPFGLKLAVAWFAIQLVILMSNRQSAGWLIACFIAPITLLHLFNLWGVTVDILSKASFALGSVELNLYLILKGIAVIFVLQWLASFSVRMTDRRLRRIKDMRASSRALILKIFQIVLYCFVFLMGMQMLGINLTALSVFGGAVGVGLGFGLQKIASNFISGIILLFEKSIEVNDLIELADGTVGFVRRTNARYTLLETQDGREVLIPNEEFISQRVISWTHSDKHARAEIAITIAYDSDVELAKKLMLTAANTHGKRVKSRQSICALHAFRDSGIELHLYFWVADIVDGRMEPKSDVMLAILKSFKEHGITIPYPQRELRITNTAAVAGA
jgi:small-conductance mechanosensitive channel